ncbi:hypothetical protein VPNG_08501 [Cytospora leucostoma]|uniref:Uncharacterized protein n=1 Tax=Cytospora leucostoma TaxID=1230097 RepID=A0A423W549_9PEZI|nr:hypothetical protein VPNG_08501 [Cytospora leucostoma]
MESNSHRGSSPNNSDQGIQSSDAYSASHPSNIGSNRHRRADPSNAFQGIQGSGDYGAPSNRFVMGPSSEQASPRLSESTRRIGIDALSQGRKSPSDHARGQVEDGPGVVPQSPSVRPFEVPRSVLWLNKRVEAAAYEEEASVARRLLPCREKLFWSHPLIDEYWTDQDEQSIERFWDSHEETLLDSSMACAASERELWAMMVHYFDCVPHDLFRYGLKFPIGTECAFERAVGRPSPYIPGDVCEALKKVISHKLWNGKVALLRYALQRMICCRVEDHDEPLRPVAYREPIYGPDGIPISEEALQKLEWVSTYRTSHLEDDDFKTLWTIMKKMDYRQEVGERFAFVLTAVDIERLCECLDNLLYDGLWAFHPCTIYYNQWKKKAYSSGEAFHPRSDDTLREWKKKCRLAELRDEQIRRRLGREAPQGPGRGYLLDIPASDHRPCYHKLPHFSKSQRNVLAGLSPAVDETHASSLTEHPRTIPISDVPAFGKRSWDGDIDGHGNNPVSSNKRQKINQQHVSPGTASGKRSRDEGEYNGDGMPANELHRVPQDPVSAGGSSGKRSCNDEDEHAAVTPAAMRPKVLHERACTAVASGKRRRDENDDDEVLPAKKRQRI